MKFKVDIPVERIGSVMKIARHIFGEDAGGIEMNAIIRQCLMLGIDDWLAWIEQGEQEEQA